MDQLNLSSRINMVRGRSGSRAQIYKISYDMPPELAGSTDFRYQLYKVDR